MKAGIRSIPAVVTGVTPNCWLGLTGSISDATWKERKPVEGGFIKASERTNEPASQALSFVSAGGFFGCRFLFALHMENEGQS